MLRDRINALASAVSAVVGIAASAVDGVDDALQVCPPPDNPAPRARPVLLSASCLCVCLCVFVSRLTAQQNCRAQRFVTVVSRRRRMRKWT